MISTPTPEHVLLLNIQNSNSHSALIGNVGVQSLDMTVSEFKNRITGVKKPVALTCDIKDVRIVFGVNLSEMRPYQVS